MTTSVTHRVPPNAWISVHFVDKQEPYAAVTVGDVVIVPRTDQYDEIITAFTKARDAHHDALRRRWGCVPTPIEGEGRCHTCESLEQLWLVTRHGVEFEVCRSCGELPTLEEIKADTHLGGAA